MLCLEPGALGEQLVDRQRGEIAFHPGDIVIQANKRLAAPHVIAVLDVNFGDCPARGVGDALDLRFDIGSNYAHKSRR